MKRRKTPKRITPLQHSRFLKGIVLILICAIAWLLFNPQSGVIHYYHKSQQAKRIAEENAQLSAENVALKQDVERIHKDTKYLEEVAREKHGLLKSNEIIFDFSKTDSSENEK